MYLVYELVCLEFSFFERDREVVRFVAGEVRRSLNVTLTLEDVDAVDPACHVYTCVVIGKSGRLCMSTWSAIAGRCRLRAHFCGNGFVHGQTTMIPSFESGTWRVN